MSRFKILISIAIGSAIGSLLSLEYLSITFWWVGTLAGGLVGYISYEFKKVLEAIPRAWRKIRGFTIDIEGLKISFKSGILFSVDMNIFVLDFFLYALLCCFLFGAYELMLGLSALFGFAALFILVFYLLVFILKDRGYSKIKRLRILSETKEETKKTLIKYNPASVLYFTVKTLVSVIIWFFTTGIPTIWNFTKVLFKEIYSDLRLLCGTHAMLGSVVGFFSGSVAIGILVGCIAGLASYEIISKRILGLVPNGA